ncbi:MAG TPA: glycosyltransferase family 2 protein [Candidatus Saccharimonadales bacterium]|nr:glycosyltransferase family 2 protein [Candidatus Saccharimonadales bacterium]
MNRPLVSIIIPTYRRQTALQRLLRSVTDSDYPKESIEVVIVDNGREETLQPALESVYKPLRIITPPENLFSNPARRMGAAVALGTYVFLLDDDNTLDPQCLLALINTLENNPDIGAVGPLMLEGDSEKIWCAGARVSRLGTTHHLYQGEQLRPGQLPDVITDIDYFPNACMVRRTVLQAVPLDEVNFPHNWAEIDFGLRIRQAGYQIACITHAIDHHHIGYGGSLTRLGSTKTYDQAKSRLLFRKRHKAGVSDWMIFWLLIFPASSAVYVWHIMRLTDHRLSVLNAYARGTMDGLRQPLETIPQLGEGI